MKAAYYVNYVDCGTAVAEFHDIFQLRGILKFSQNNFVIHRMWCESCWPMSMTRPKFPLTQMRYHATYVVKAYAACKNLTLNLIETESLTLYYNSVMGSWFCKEIGAPSILSMYFFFLRPQSHFRIEWQRSLYSLFLTRGNSQSNKSLKARVNECNKTKNDQDKTQRCLLSEIYIATDYEYLSRLNWREQVPRECTCC